MALISNRIHRAADYVKHGFAITPLNGKVPINKNWTKTKPDVDLDTEIFENKNFGIVLQDDDLVIDVDPRHFKDGDNPLERLTKNLQIKLLSFVVETGGGGLHIYFKKSKDVKIKRSIAHYKGLEFKSKGQQVVGAGCIHPSSGKEYRVVQGDIKNIKMAPKELLHLLKDDIVFQDTGIQQFVDDAQTCNRFSEYLVTSAPLAIQGDQGDNTTFKVACRGRDFGLTPDKTYELMSKLWNVNCQPPWEERLLKQKVQNAYIYNEDVAGKRNPASDFDVITDPTLDPNRIKIKWDVGANGQIKKTLANTVNFFIYPDGELLDLFKFNEFTNDIEFVKLAPWHRGKLPKNKVWTDNDAIQCKYYLSSEKHFDMSTTTIHEAVINLARMKPYHPVRRYLKGLEWDGVDRLDRWLIDYAGVEENPYTLTIGRKVLVAGVARIFSPGCKFDFMLVFEGKQGIYKSTLCSILGKSWYGDIILNTHDKDTVDAMRGKWIIEVSEMECTRRADTQALKAFVSRQCDRVRLAYARQTEDYARQCIFIGTINPEAVGYLKDNTGNRRFWPVRCINPIKINKLKVDMDQIWAEAVMCYELGEELYITDRDVIAHATREVEDRKEADPWAHQISMWLDKKNDSGITKNVVTTSDVYSDCLGIPTTQYNRVNQSRISNILCFELGWEKGVFYSSAAGKTVSGFKRPNFNIKKLEKK